MTGDAGLRTREPKGLPVSDPRKWSPRSLLPACVALALGLVGWQLLVVTSGGWVPSLGDISQSFLEIVAEPGTYRSFAVTAGRILIGFTCIMALSLALGTAIGTFHTLDSLLRPLLVLALATPDPVYFIMALMILGTDAWVPMVALIASLVPFATGIFRGAVVGRERSLDEMARVYGFGSARTFRHILIPQIVPAVVAAGRTTFSLTWKVVVLMEALTRPNGVGADIYLSFRLLDPALMIVLAAYFIAFMRIAETMVFPRLQGASTRWMTT